MTNPRLVLGFLAIFLLAGCGNPTRNNINGEWRAALTPTQSGSAMSMTFDFSTATDGTVTGSVSGITGDNGCLSGLGTPNTSYGKTAGANGPVYAFLFTAQTQNPSTPTGITLSGQLVDGKITGTWSMGGTFAQLQCNDSGNFVMEAVPTPFLPR